DVFLDYSTYMCVSHLRKKNGELITLDLKVIPIISKKERGYFLFVGRDISLEVELIKSLERAKNYDSLTGLYTLEGLLSLTKEFYERVTHQVLVIDLDLYNFSSINEVYGFDVGDRILKGVAERLKDKFEKEAHLGRVSSDEFVLVFYKLKEHQEVSRKISEIFEIFKEPFVVAKSFITLRFNMGIAFYLKDGKDLEEVFRRANAALAMAKKEAPNTYKFYDSTVEQVVRKNLEVEKLIEEALEKKYFQFYFQPYFEATKLTLVGAEALIRIVKPDGEVISPGYFIDQLERSPLRKEFELWAFETIVELVNTWGIPLSLNLNAKTLLDYTFWLNVADLLINLKYPLVIEITERDLVVDSEKVAEMLKHIKEEFPLLRIAIDDFGTGYSNLATLVSLPIDVIKIDLSFVRDLHINERNRVI
ncbi:MAG: EAL domain-containing protein, partial [Caldimicrobium sp.]